MFDERTVKDRIAAIKRQHRKSKLCKDMPFALYAFFEVIADEVSRLDMNLSLRDAQHLSEELYKLHTVLKGNKDV